jgi:hypothetical protein
MFVHRPTKNIGKKSYQSVLLAESFRENGKVRRRTLANMSQWPHHMVAGVEALCRGGAVIGKDDIATGVGKCFGVPYVFQQLANRTYLTKALGTSAHAKVALLMIIASIVEPTSKAGFIEWTKNQTVKEVFGIDEITLSQAYSACNWLAKHQDEIEERLFKLRGGKQEFCYLYDVTSSYLEGIKNKLAAFGYNRDKKRGKRQIVSGMFADADGFPVTIKAFKGNTNDETAFSTQISDVLERFKISKVAFVADRGAMKSKHMALLKNEGIHHISALTKPQIQALINKEVIQLGVFDNEIQEIEHEGRRLIMRRNPIRAEQTKKDRKERLATAVSKIEARAAKLKVSSIAIPKKAYNYAIVTAHKYKVQNFLEISLNRRRLVVTINEAAIKKEEILDGCYAIQTDVLSADATAKEVHDRYKDLKYVELAWKEMKTGQLEMRPFYVRNEPITRGHIFMKMLAYYLLRHFWLAVKDIPELQDKVRESLWALEGIYTTHVKLQNVSFEMVPTELSNTQNAVLAALNIQLPKQKVLSAA